MKTSMLSGKNPPVKTINSMPLSLQRRWLARAPQERKLIIAVAAVLLAGLYLWLLYAGSQTSSAMRASLPGLRMQAHTLELQAAEIESLRLLPMPTGSDSALLPWVQTSAANAGLTEMLTSIEARGVDQVAIEFGAIPFSVWLDWISTLGQQNIQVESVHIESLTAPGLVSVSLLLNRAVFA